jgi:hypothetical protein
VKVKGGKVSISIGRRSVKVELSESKPVSLTCKGTEDKTLRNLYIKAKGDGFRVSGACDLVIIDSYVEVTGYAIRASGGSDVILKNSTIKGGKGAVHVSGGADVKAEGSKVIGRIIKTGGGDFEIDDDDD